MRAEAVLWLRRALGVGLLLGLWQLAALFFPPLVVPPIPQVAATLAELIREPDFGPTVGTTLLRLVTGLGIGITAGAVLGLLFGLYPKLEDVGTPLIHVLQSVPPVCWVVLALVWFGFNGRPCIFIVATATVPTVVINLSHGVRGVDRQLLEMARVFRIPAALRIRYIYVSQILPFFRAGCSLALGLCWKSGIAAEVIGLPEHTIGENLYNAKIYLNTPDLFAWTIVIVLISLVFERLFLALVDRGVRYLERS